MTEFGLLAPVMCVLLIGTFDVGHSLYMRSVLQGAVQKASRDTGLESGGLTTNQTTIDNKVRAQIRSIHKTAAVAITRRSYRNFTQASAPQLEPFTDGNSDGLCNNSEPYTDFNNSNARDVNNGIVGQGGAQDSVVYTVRVTYPRLLPLDGFINVPAQQVVEASTVMSNQPYGEQAAPPVRNCPMVAT